MPLTQDGRMMAISTPKGKDYLVLNAFEVTEGMSQLYSIKAELLHEETVADYVPTVVNPKEMLGAGVSIVVRSDDGATREFNGIVNRFSQGNRDIRFSYYNATIVPHIWLLTQKVQSQIFQQKSVSEILKKMFDGFTVKYELQRTYEPRNYCVQYRETDFDFASRLMEEEGIFYFFTHADGREQMVVADTPQSHPVCASKSDVPFFINVGDQEDFFSSVNAFLSGYTLQTGKITLWDANFQLPGKNLERQESSVFTYGDNKNLEHYDFPAGYARKYDGISNSGGEQSGELQKLFPDRDATTKNWMEGLDADVEKATGRGDCCSFTVGNKFTLTNHPNSELNKAYVLTSVTHSAQQHPGYATDLPIENPYTNEFECIAFGSGKPCFRPQRVTPKPIINGSQTAFVVGPAGEEIFTDKYGRVKVQFHWDRDGQSDSVSSCWVRVAQAWAGNKWGGMFIPRIGMEVLVHFLEGDPDQPIITGCVYNPAAMPPYTLPDEKTKSTMKSNSSKGSGGFNEIRFEDKKGSEEVFIHGEKNLEIRVKNDRHEWIGRDRHLYVYRDKREKVVRDVHVIVERDQIQNVKRDIHQKVDGKIASETTGSVSDKIGGNRAVKIGGNDSLEVAGNETIKASVIVLEAASSLTLKCGGSSININPGGIQIVGTPMLMLNSGGSPTPGTPGTLVAPSAPEEAEIAVNADPGNTSPTYKHQRQALPPAKQPTYSQPHHKPESQANKKKKSWIDIFLKNEDGEPCPGEKYRVTLPDGTTLAEGTLDQDGFAKVSNIDPGNCKVTFPDLDRRSWNKE